MAKKYTTRTNKTRQIIPKTCEETKLKQQRLEDWQFTLFFNFQLNWDLEETASAENFSLQMRKPPSLLTTKSHWLAKINKLQ